MNVNPLPLPLLLLSPWLPSHATYVAVFVHMCDQVDHAEAHLFQLYHAREVYTGHTTWFSIV